MRHKVEVEGRTFRVPVPGTTEFTTHDFLIVVFDERPIWFTRGIELRFSLPGELHDFYLRTGLRVVATHSSDYLPIKMEVTQRGDLLLRQSDFLTPRVRSCSPLLKRTA